jgi:hypothetical protein
MKKLLLPVLFIALAIVACTKEGANDGSGTDTNPIDSTTTPTNPGGGKKDSIVTFTDISIGWKPNSESYGRIFSSATGKVYFDGAADTMGKYVDLAFNHFGTYNMNFVSPASADFDLKFSGATNTVIRNFVPSDSFRAEAFDTLRNAATIKNLYVYDDGNDFASTSIPCLVFFRNNNGKKGIVKVKAYTNDHIVVDVKVIY